MADKAPTAVTTGTGKTGYINPELADVARVAGARGASEAELRAAQRTANADAIAAEQEAALKARFSGLGGAVEAELAPQAAGFARGITMGLSDPLLLSGAEAVGGRSTREDLRQRMLSYQAVNPVGSVTGEIGGIAAGTLLGGEGGAANLPGVVGRMGAGLERAAVESVGRGVGGRVAGGVLSGAAEGALYGAGKTASEAALHDEPLTGEKLVAGATHGAIFGGAAGGLLAGGGALLRGETSGFRPPSGAGEVGGAPRGSIADRLQREADVKTIKAMGGSAGDIRALESRVPGGYQRVAQELRQDIEAVTGKSIGRHSRESLHEYAVSRNEEMRDQLGTLITKLDDAKTGAPDAAAFTQRIRQELIAPKLIQRGDGSFVAMPGQEKTVKALGEWVGRIDDAFDGRAPTFAEWQRMRVGLDKDIFQGTAKASPKVEALRQMRGIMEGELETSGERAAQAMGGSFIAEYQAVKSLYQSTKKAVELTERGLSRDVVNNTFGLTSRIAGTVMGAAGLSAGGPVGGLMAGGASALLGKAVQSRGDVLAADLLGRAATLLGARRIASRVEARMGRDVAALIRPSNDNAGSLAAAFAPPARAAAAPLGVSLTGDRRADYRKLADRVTAAASNPAATTEQVSRSVGELGDHAPAATAAVIATTLRGLNFLASKLPPSRFDQYSIQPHLQGGSRASDSEISRFMRFAKAVDDPLIVLREAKAGTLTRDHVDAVKEVYPLLYDQMRQDVMRHLVDSKSPLAYGARIQLGILLDIPTDKTLSPEFMTAVQATYSSDEKAGAESPPPTLSRHVNVAGPQQTAMQQAAGRVP